MTLMVEAARVVEMRLRMIALGKGTPDEMFLMVTEKLDAMEEAKAIIIRGGDPSLVIDEYRKIVAANVARLSALRTSDPGHAALAGLFGAHVPRRSQPRNRCPGLIRFCDE
jgi:hypothetical protein